MELSSPGLSTSMGSNIKKCRSEIGDMHQNESEIFVNDTNNDNSRQNDILDSENSTSTELNRSHSEIELKSPSVETASVLLKNKQSKMPSETPSKQCRVAQNVPHKENGCDDDTETVLEVSEMESDELKYRYTHCATTSANAPNTNDSALDEDIVEPLDITINAEEANCVSSCSSPKPTRIIPKESHSDPSGNEKGSQNINEAFEYTSCTSKNNLGSCDFIPNPTEASQEEFQNEGYPSSEVNSLDQTKPNNANIDIVNHSKEQQNNTIKEAGEVGLPESDSLSSHDTLSDNLKQNQFSLSMQTLDTNDQNTSNSLMAKDCDPVAHPKVSNLSSPIPNSSSVSGPSSSNSQMQMAAPLMPATQKSYDYLLKVLLVGDSDVGKQEIISDMEDGTTDSPFCSSAGAAFKTTIILIDGKRVKLQLWDTSGQGRFCTIIRSYSRGAQGILLVYDITNKWSFEGINRWLKEVDQHAPGIPKVLVGNRLHLAFKRQVHQEEAEEYAEKHSMGFFEVSPLVNFNISETLVELARMALRRNGMERWNGRSNKVSTLYELCAHSIVNRTTVYGIDRLKLPSSVKQNLKSYAVTNYSISQTNKKFLRRPGSSSQYYTSGSFKNKQSGGSPASSICNSLRRVHRTRQHTPLANTPADAANVNCGPNRKSCTIS